MEPVTQNSCSKILIAEKRHSKFLQVYIDRLHNFIIEERNKFALEKASMIIDHDELVRDRNELVLDRRRLATERDYYREKYESSIIELDEVKEIINAKKKIQRRDNTIANLRLQNFLLFKDNDELVRLLKKKKCAKIPVLVRKVKKVDRAKTCIIRKPFMKCCKECTRKKLKDFRGDKCKVYCSDCKQCFANRHARDKHLNKFIPCTFRGCMKTFNHTTSLNDHVKNVHGEKQFGCSTCGYSTAYHKHLIRHLISLH